MSASTPTETAQAAPSQNLYEGMFLLDSSRFATDPEGSEKAVLEILNRAGAEVVANRPWMDGKLAYDIEGQRKGLHYLTYFRMDGKGVAEISRLCKLSDLVLRHLVIKHPETLFDAMVSALVGHDPSALVSDDSDESSSDSDNKNNDNTDKNNDNTDDND